MIEEARVRALALALPEAVELPHWGNPSFRVGKRIFATLGEYEGLAVLKIPVDEQEVLMAAMPDTFERNSWSGQGWLGVRLDAIGEDVFEELVESAWRLVAPKRAIRALEASRAR
ncbi:MAG: MmcQ/YjbR family DNA-binding protein [Thermoanaerobaculia bacterium]|nr:MmcQ/YjbR family DNA-binding protein [Thermoanaerobaculia bacterium]